MTEVNIHVFQLYPNGNIIFKYLMNKRFERNSEQYVLFKSLEGTYNPWAMRDENRLADVEKNLVFLNIIYNNCP